jgi:hypothetical protein
MFIFGGSFLCFESFGRSYGSGSAWIPILFRSWIRIRIRLKAGSGSALKSELEAQHRAVEGCRRSQGLGAQNGALVVYRLVVADSRHFEVELDPDPH